MTSALSSQKGQDHTIEPENLTLENLETALSNDTKVKLAGIDIDGMRS